MTKLEKDGAIIYKHSQGSHICVVAWCLVSGNVVLESMALNDSRDLCKVRAAELRCMRKPVHKFCGAHEDGQPDCLMQLMTLNYS